SLTPLNVFSLRVQAQSYFSQSIIIGSIGSFKSQILNSQLGFFGFQQVIVYLASFKPSTLKVPPKLLVALSDDQKYCVSFSRTSRLNEHSTGPYNCESLGFLMRTTYPS